MTTTTDIKKYYDKENKKQYYQQNKEKIAKQRNEKYICSCGDTLTKHNKNRHEQTEKHKQCKLLQPKIILCDICFDEYKNTPSSKKKHVNGSRHKEYINNI